MEFFSFGDVENSLELRKWQSNRFLFFFFLLFFLCVISSVCLIPTRQSITRVVQSPSCKSSFILWYYRVSKSTRVDSLRYGFKILHQRMMCIQVFIVVVASATVFCRLHSILFVRREFLSEVANEGKAIMSLVGFLSLDVEDLDLHPLWNGNFVFLLLCFVFAARFGESAHYLGKCNLKSFSWKVYGCTFQTKK